MQLAVLFVMNCSGKGVLQMNFSSIQKSVDEITFLEQGHRLNAFLKYFVCKSFVIEIAIISCLILQLYKGVIFYYLYSKVICTQHIYSKPIMPF